MDIHSLHLRLRTQIEQLSRLQQELFIKSPAPTNEELDHFLNGIRNLYESALHLRHQTELHTMEQLEFAIADQYNKLHAEPVPPVQNVPEPVKKEEQPLAVIQPSSPIMEEKSEPAPTPVATISENEIFTEPVVSINKIIADISIAAAADAVKSDTRNRKALDLHEQFTETPTLAGKFEDKETLADRIAHQSTGSRRLSDNLQHKPIKDLKAAIGINEKFQFINHLFNGDATSYHQAIEQLNSSVDYPAACQVIQGSFSEKYQWDQRSATAELFMDLIERRFMA